MDQVQDAPLWTRDGDDQERRRRDDERRRLAHTLAARYNDGATVRELAAEYGLPYTTARRLLCLVTDLRRRGRRRVPQ